MKKFFILLIIFMLGMSINLFAQEKYGEEFIFSQDKSTVTSYYTKTSYEPLKTYGISSISPYYLSLSQRPDTIIRNAILSPTDQYNYPGDSLVRKLFLKTKVFHRYMVVDRFTSEIYLKIEEGNPISVDWGRNISGILAGIALILYVIKRAKP